MNETLLNEEGLQEFVNSYNKKVNGKITSLGNNDIKEFKAATPFSDGLTVVNAVTNGNTNIEALYIYNGLDAKYSDAALGTKAGKELNDKITSLEGNKTKYKTITLSASGWVQNNDLYEYTVNDNTVTANTLVTGYPDIENQAKLSDGDIVSASGKYTIRTSVLPEEDITMNIVMQNVSVVS